MVQGLYLGPSLLLLDPSLPFYGFPLSDPSCRDNHSTDSALFSRRAAFKEARRVAGMGTVTAHLYLLCSLVFLSFLLKTYILFITLKD